MVNTPSEPDPRLTPDTHERGNPTTAGGTPSAESTSLDSDSARTGQSPAPRGQGRGMTPMMIVLVVAVVLVVAGLIAFVAALG